MTEKKKLTVSERQARWRAQNLERSREMRRIDNFKRRNPDKTPPVNSYKEIPTHFQSTKAEREKATRERRRVYNANRVFKKPPTEASIRAKKDLKRWLALDQGLDVGMLIPTFIPKGYAQSFDFRTMSYFLVRDRSTIERIQT